MSMNATDLKRLTPAEFDTMAKDERLRYELIDGIVLMSPSPSREHQKIEVNLIRKLGDILDQTPCEPLHEYDVAFEDSVYKPDVMVFCDSEALIPLIVFEILSPSTRQRDILIKPLRYQEMGIKEYWIIDPKVKIVTVHDFVHETAETYGLGEIIHSLALPEVVIAVADIFA